MPMNRVFIAALLTISAYTSSHANPLLNGFSAHYNVDRNGMALGVVKKELSLTPPDTLTFKSTTIAEGIVALFVSDILTEESTIQLKNNVLRPLRYEYKKTDGKKGKQIKVEFDWKNKRLNHSAIPDKVDLAANSHDLLSLQLALSQGLAQQQKKFDFIVVNHKRVKQFVITIAGTQNLKTSQGKLKTIRLEQERNNSRYWFSFWFAPDLNYLPVIIQKTEHDGDKVTMRLRELDGKPISIHVKGEEEF